MTSALHQIRQLGEELRQAFADERVAIAKLDHARLSELADHKRRICDALVVLRDQVEPSPAIRDLFVAIQVEARATAMLAAAATEAVRALLGTEATGYDRRARSTAAPALRLLATY